MNGTARPTPSRFRIWVVGRLSERVTAGIPGVGHRDETGGTVLDGSYVDDAQLHGLLEQLRDLGIAVRRFEIDEGVPTIADPERHDARPGPAASAAARPAARRSVP